MTDKSSSARRPLTWNRTLEDLSPPFSAWRKRFHPGKLLEHFNDLSIAGCLLDDFHQLFRHQWGNVIGDELLKFCAELRIFKYLAHRFLQDLDPILGGSRRQNERRGRRSKTTPHRQELLFLISLSKTLDLRQLDEAWVRMLIALRNFQDRMKIHYPFFHPFRITP